jgi:predicted kinase
VRVLIVMTGLPVTGKSVIADAIARSFPAPCFSVDPLEATLLRLGIKREQRSDVAAYDLAYTLATSQLRLGQSAVIDAVNGYPPVQTAWRELAVAHSTPIVVIATICSDGDLHRARVESRQREIDGFIYEPTWRDIENIRASWYVPFPSPDLVLDAVEHVEGNVERALAVLNATRS